MTISNDKPIVDEENVIYRKEVDLIYEILERDNALLITGVGGIGKTTIANLYHHKYKDNYHAILRFDYSHFREPLSQVTEILRDLNNSNEKSLLIIDDIDENGLVIISDYYGSINKNWHIILISRIVIKDFRIPIITISGLNLEESYRLIEKRFHETYKDEDKLVIKELLNFVDGNPLIIELMSGIYKHRSFKSIKEFRNELAHNLSFTLGIAKKPIEIYIDTNNTEQINKVYSETIEFIKKNKLDVEKELPSQDGSWYKRIFVKLMDVSQRDEVKEKFREAEYGIKLHTITKQQSEIDKNQAEAVSSIIESIKEIPNAAIKVGSILIVKITVSNTPTIAVKNLSLNEMLELENKPSLLKSPAELLECLGQVNIENTELLG